MAWWFSVWYFWVLVIFIPPKGLLQVNFCILFIHSTFLLVFPLPLTVLFSEMLYFLCIWLFICLQAFSIDIFLLLFWKVILLSSVTGIFYSLFSNISYCFFLLVLTGLLAVEFLQYFHCFVSLYIYSSFGHLLVRAVSLFVLIVSFPSSYVCSFVSLRKVPILPITTFAPT